MRWDFKTEDERKEYERKLNTLARHELIHSILKEICADMIICQLNGWDPMELPTLIKQEITNIEEQWKRKHESQD